MPTYDFTCRKCGRRETVVRRVQSRDDELLCACSSQMERVQVYPVKLGGVDFKPYRSPASGRVIDSPTKERDELARTGTFIDEPGVKSQIERRRKEVAEESSSVIERAVAKTFGELSVERNWNV